MAESQGDAYVRRDVFEARMDRMEMLLEKTVIEIKSYVDKSTGETKTYVEKAIGDLRDEVKTEISGLKAEIGTIRTEVAEVKNDVKVLTARVDALEQTLGARIGAVESTLSWWIALFAALIAMIAFFTPVVEYIRKRLKPSYFSEEMEKIAERVANNVLERHLSGGKQ